MSEEMEPRPVVQPEQETDPTPPDPSSDPPPTKEARPSMLPAWIQFPRRLVILLLAYLGALGVIFLMFNALPENPINKLSERPMMEIIGESLGNSIYVLLAALLITILLVLIGVAIAYAISLLGKKSVLRAVLKTIGDLLLSIPASAPVFFLGLLLVYVLAIQAGWLPGFGGWDIGEAAGGTVPFSARFKHLIMPSLSLAIFPAVLIGKALARDITLDYESRGSKTWLAAIFKLLALLLLQFGGVLSALVVVEIVFSYPGIGRSLLASIGQMDMVVTMGVLMAMVTLVFGARLLAELFRAIERLVRGHAPIAEEITEKSPKAQKLGLIISLVLLLIPLVFGVLGIVSSDDKVLTPDPSARTSEPGSGHPLGTDALGRDVAARMTRGIANSLAVGGLTAGGVMLAALIGGLLTGLLTDKGTWWSESIADLLLFPADVLTLIPVIPFVAVEMVLLQPSRDEPLVFIAILALVIGIIMLPRATRLYQTLWYTTPDHKKWLKRFLAGVPALFLSTMFASMLAFEGLNFLGFGLYPPAATIGGMLTDFWRYRVQSLGSILIPGFAFTLVLFTLFTASDALIGVFHSKEPMGQLNE